MFFWVYIVGSIMQHHATFCNVLSKAETLQGAPQTSKMESFTTIANGRKSLTVVSKFFILGHWKKFR